MTPEPNAFTISTNSEMTQESGEGNKIKTLTDGRPLAASSPIKSTLPITEDFTTRALRFLSTASNETIGGIAVGLAASTYLVLGRVGLILIGTLGGIVLHATWEAHVNADNVEAIRREKGLDITKRLLDWRAKNGKILDDNDGEELDTDASGLPGKGFEDFQPETASALTELVEAVVRDYVKWWYNPMFYAPGPDESFATACRKVLTGFLRSISNHISRKRPADAFVDFLTNSSSIVIVFLNELSTAVNSSSSNAAPAEAIQEYLLLSPDSSLANILSSRQQKRKFKLIAEDILENFLDRSVYSADPSRIFLREVLAGVVMEMSLTTCSKPEWINGWIVYLLEEGEPDFSHAIDVGMGASPGDDIDGNVGNVGIAKSRRSEEKRHRKRLSKAEEAMEEAMEEAKRLSDLIAAEDKKRLPNVGTGERPKETTSNIQKSPSTPETKTSSTTLQRTISATDKVQSSDNILPVIDESRSAQSPPQSSLIIEETKSGHDNMSSDDSVGLATPKSGSDSDPSSPKPPANLAKSSFTSFDQILPPSRETPTEEERPQLPRRITNALTLHNAHITLHDDSSASDKGKIRNKPNWEYWVQIEPESNQHPGWMILRRYADFETLHEVLRRIATISGVNAFLETHRELPDWKAHTKPSLRGELERYIRDACWYQPLAESEGMKRFLEKDHAQASSSGKGFPGLGWPTPAAFETMGKGMLDALTAAPKGAAEGGKAVLGGVTGVFGSIGNSLGPKKRDSIQGVAAPSGHSPGRASTSALPVMDTTSNARGHSPGRASTNMLPRMDSSPALSGTRHSRISEDSLRTSPIVQTQPSKPAPMERKSSYVAIAEDGSERVIPLQGRRSMSRTRSSRSSASNSREPSRTPSISGVRIASPREVQQMILPPPPSEIPDDYASPTDARGPHSQADSIASPRTSTSNAPSSIMSPSRTSTASTRPAAASKRKDFAPLTEPETRIVVELLFAIINELYTLSSAWNIRRTLLTAAKTFLLRPGNPSLTSIQNLIQESIITANTSDAGIAENLKKLRANTMPTEAELAAWPAEMSDEDKEKLRIKARRLLVERGVPTALVGVMGQGATGEAVGRVFDCLQIDDVARGLMFGLLLQGVQAMIH